MNEADIPKYGIGFVLGVFTLYAVARLASPIIQTRIAVAVADRVVSLQTGVIGAAPLTRNMALTGIGVPIAESVMEALYLG